VLRSGLVCRAVGANFVSLAEQPCERARDFIVVGGGGCAGRCGQLTLAWGSFGHELLDSLQDSAKTGTQVLWSDTIFLRLFRKPTRVGV
jgi:hypothetical protein